MNPMMLCGMTQEPSIYYHQNPTVGFHLALLHTTDQDITVDTIYNECFKQFREWCNGFRKLKKKNLITIRIFNCLKIQTF